MDKITIHCPFCDKEIEVLHSPSIVTTKRSVTATFGATTKIVRSTEKYEVPSDCPNCGKSAKEIKKALKEGGESKSVSHAEMLERIKKLGLATRI